MVFALLATLIVSLVVALLAALQLGDFFRAGDELLAVLIAVAGFAVLSITVLATVTRQAVANAECDRRRAGPRSHRLGSVARHRRAHRRALGRAFAGRV